MNEDEYYMRKALRLAGKGRHTLPNPKVGAVIVKGHRIISTGYHSYFGGPHAEAAAIADSPEPVSGATMYVSLEPCNHFGKTPPCSELIIKNKIAKVVIGSEDINPNVEGGGIKHLEKAGVIVKTGILRGAAQELNRVFNKLALLKTPYIYMKLAASLDSKISLLNGRSKWITNEPARKFVHKMRSQMDAVLVGIETVIADDPSLNVRYGYRKKNLKRVVLDSNLRIPPDSKILNADGNAIIFYTNADQKKIELLKKMRTILVRAPAVQKNYVDVDFCLKELYNMGVYRLLVEGGARIFSTFLENRIADEVMWFYGNKIFGSGRDAFSLNTITDISDAVTLRNVKIRRFKDNFLVRGYVNVYGNY